MHTFVDAHTLYRHNIHVAKPIKTHDFSCQGAIFIHDISLSATNFNLVRTNLIYSFKDTLMNIFQLETLMKQISAGINWIYFYDFPAANLTLINIAISSDSI